MGQVSGDPKQHDQKALLARIPAFPPIVLRLLTLLGSEEVGIRELVELVSADPAFSAQILRVANSPLFGYRSQIDSLQSGLMVLGLRRVRSLTLTVATANHVKAAIRVQELARCWQHMLATALLTDELAHSCSAFQDRAYTAGLLHDMGRLGLLLAYPAEYAQLLRNADFNALELLDCEKESLGMDHCEAGRALAEQWNLPHDIQIVSARHHDPQSGSEPDLLGLVHLGCKLADSLGFWVVKPLQPRTPEEIHASLPAPLQDRLRFDAKNWRDMVERRIRCFSDSDSFAGMGSSTEEDLALPVAELAKLRFPDPNEPASLGRELLTLVAIGLTFTTVIVLVVYLALR